MKSQGTSSLVGLVAFALLVAVGIAGYKLIRSGCPLARPPAPPNGAAIPT